MNDVASVPVFPIEDTVAHTHQLLKTSRHWKVDPGELAFIMPHRQRAAAKGVGSTIASIMAGGGPFMLRIAPDLVQTLLRRIGYIQQDETVCKEAITLLRKIGPHSAILAQAGFSPSDGLLETDLHEVFSNQEINHQYRCAPSDANVRDFLVSQGKLSTIKAKRDEVKLKMRDFLHQTYPDMSLPHLYAGLVARMVKHFNRNSPSLHKPKGSMP